MKRLLKFILLTLPLLSSCDYGYTSQSVKYENYFYLWPTGMEYAKFLDTSASKFLCYYNYSYTYYLKYKDGSEINYSGKYEFKDETFYLYEDETLKITLPKLNYYEFKEDIVYQEVTYTLIWHAQHIFD